MKGYEHPTTLFMGYGTFYFYLYHLCLKSLQEFMQFTCWMQTDSLMAANQIPNVKPSQTTLLVSLLPSTSTLTHIHLTALCLGLPGWAVTRKVKQIWILLKQETASDSGISWAISKFAPRARQTTTPAPHQSVSFTGRMSFLPPNQQHQSTEGKAINHPHPELPFISITQLVSWHSFHHDSTATLLNIIITDIVLNMKASF